MDYKSIVNDLPTGLLISDVNHKIILANPKIAQLFCCTVNDMLQQNINEYISTPSHNFANIMAINEKEPNKEWQLTSSTNEIFAATISGKAQYKKEQFTGYIINIQKVPNKYLLINQKYQELQKELDDFSYIISHDLKAPLRAVITLSEWICQDYEAQLDDMGKMQLQLLNDRVRKMHDLIDGVLQYSRIGRWINPSTVIDLSQIIDKVKKELAIPENFTLVVKSDMPQLFADEQRIYEIFFHLVSNAIKHNDKKEPRLYISCEKQANSFYLIFDDNGYGIEERHLDRIFKIFQSIKNDDKNSVGLGLTLATKIVKMYNGKLQLSSVPQKGTIITIELPNKLLQV